MVCYKKEQQDISYMKEEMGKTGDLTGKEEGGQYRRKGKEKGKTLRIFKAIKNAITMKNRPEIEREQGEVYGKV